MSSCFAQGCRNIDGSIRVSSTYLRWWAAQRVLCAAETVLALVAAVNLPIPLALAVIGQMWFWVRLLRWVRSCLPAPNTTRQTARPLSAY